MDAGINNESEKINGMEVKVSKMVRLPYQYFFFFLQMLAIKCVCNEIRKLILKNRVIFSRCVLTD